MYSAKLFKVTKGGSVTGALTQAFGGKTAVTDSGRIFSIYEQIADYANKHNLDVVKISDTNETLLGKDGVAVLFKSHS